MVRVRVRVRVRVTAVVRVGVGVKVRVRVRVRVRVGVGVRASRAARQRHSQCIRGGNAGLGGGLGGGKGSVGSGLAAARSSAAHNWVRLWGYGSPTGYGRVEASSVGSTSPTHADAPQPHLGPPARLRSSSPRQG